MRTDSQIFREETLKNLKQIYSISSKTETSLRMGLEMQYNLLLQFNSDRENDLYRKQLNKNCELLSNILLGCPTLMLVPSGSHIQFDENGRIGYIELPQK